MATQQPPAAPSAPVLDDIRLSFSLFDAWEDRYRFLIDLGRDVGQLPPASRTAANLVRGCQSQVWLVPSYDANAGRVRLAIDSDALIVRGLIAIALAAYNGKSPRQILDFDIEELFAELELLTHLSPARGNGLRAMVGKIRGIAEKYA